MLGLTDVHKRFPAPRRGRRHADGAAGGGRVALDGLTLRVEPGELFGLLGPNGAGKSTAIAVAAGLLASDRGRVDVAGRGSPRDPAARAALGLAPQEPALYDELTALENLRFAAALLGVPRREADARGRDLLERLGLAERAHDRAGRLSGGMRRRLNIAAAVIHRPPLVLLDEPTAGVDAHARLAIGEFVRTLAGEGAAVVYATHHMDEAEALCARVAVVDLGRVIALGTPDELIARHGGPERVVLERRGDTGDGETRVVETDDAAAVVEAAVADAHATGGRSLTGLRVERPGLGDVFLNLTGRRLRG